MHDNGVTLQKKVLQNLDIPYSYELAKRMEQYRSHPTLGYRPAGSKAEFETGEMLKTEMEKIGLSEVTKDAVTVDGWEFHKAALSYTNAAGETVSAELGAYQKSMRRHSTHRISPDRRMLPLFPFPEKMRQACWSCCVIRRK